MGSELAARYASIRQQSVALCEPLAIEDLVVQPAPFVSPPKWHLAHTTWFFETFVLAAASASYQRFDPSYGRLFNSYYKSQGEHWQQAERGTLSRPRVSEVHAYRDAIDEAMHELLDGGVEGDLAEVLEVGLHHEQQHHELLLMDIKAILAANPSMPAYRDAPVVSHEPVAATWIERPGCHASIGVGKDHVGYAIDNERPDHEVILTPHALASQLVTCGEVLDFIADGGYDAPGLWLSDGWDHAQAYGWRAPRYWFDRDGQWWLYTLAGARPVDRDEPVSHVSCYEADAIARWSRARLPTEAEWEVAAREGPVAGQFLDSDILAPAPASTSSFSGMHGSLWQWTSTAYGAYPGYRQPEGARGEYNAKFMCNQQVLRGGCYGTPRSHYRVTYRNFYKPEMRWQLAGFRLARDVG